MRPGRGPPAQEGGRLRLGRHRGGEEEHGEDEADERAGTIFAGGKRVLPILLKAFEACEMSYLVSPIYVRLGDFYSKCVLSFCWQTVFYLRKS